MFLSPAPAQPAKLTAHDLYTRDFQRLDLHRCNHPEAFPGPAKLKAWKCGQCAVQALLELHSRPYPNHGNVTLFTLTLDRPAIKTYQNVSKHVKPGTVKIHGISPCPGLTTTEYNKINTYQYLKASSIRISRGKNGMSISFWLCPTDA